MRALIHPIRTLEDGTIVHAVKPVDPSGTVVRVDHNADTDPDGSVLAKAKLALGLAEEDELVLEAPGNTVFRAALAAEEKPLGVFLGLPPRE